MLKNKLVILGGGESGVGAAILGAKQGFEVFVSDFGEIKDEYKAVLDQRGLKYEEKQHTEAIILDADLVMKSPGIPEKAPIVVKLHERNIPVISEIEFAGRYTTAKTICITGSNGKTTTTMLSYEILKRAGLKVGLAGNVGKSFALQVAEDDFDYYVIELSSFQLDGMFDFRADIAVLMNITPDHLDRYDYKMQNYTDSKMRITQNQRPEDWFVYCADDPIIQVELTKRDIKAHKVPFTIMQVLQEGGWVENDTMKLNVNNNTFDMTIYELALQGKHNLNNSMAAGISGSILNLRKEGIRECLSDFQGVEHRLERFLRVHNIEFINDSKATNINSVWYALESMNTPVVWIVGGIDKGNDYSQLFDLVKEKVKAIVCLGKDNSKIIAAFDGKVKQIVDTKSIEEAVRSAYFLAAKGDTVLLSPACASFDLFKNYEERGRQFKDAVRNL
ncbi:MAG TPA: UDP-N-acetylmuramoyl-L-alanine--D-glutamate ligase [Prolixibacteraceae bacterium]|nr:UDP-N-acetylmuramoyl-L-alanine--D-glutamate ligase [Prolixibacteraceae bacterium]